MWVFGFGSLVNAPGFRYSRSLVGFVKSYCRRFYQGSPDHRGTPQHPGRVATLVRAARCMELERDMGEVYVNGDDSDRCWGVAYEILCEDIEETIAKLDHREKAGFQKVPMSVWQREGRDEGVLEWVSVTDAIVYVADEGNSDWLGACCLNDTAKHIASSAGPSGHNSHYLFALVDSLRELHVLQYDRYLIDLDRAVRELVGQDMSRKEGVIDNVED